MKKILKIEFYSNKTIRSCVWSKKKKRKSKAILLEFQSSNEGIRSLRIEKKEILRRQRNYENTQFKEIIK